MLFFNFSYYCFFDCTYFLSFSFFTVNSFCYFNRLKHGITEGSGTSGIACLRSLMFSKCCLYIYSLDLPASVDDGNMESRGFIVNFCLFVKANDFSGKLCE